MPRPAALTMIESPDLHRPPPRRRPPWPTRAARVTTVHGPLHEARVPRPVPDGHPAGSRETGSPPLYAISTGHRADSRYYVGRRGSARGAGPRCRRPAGSRVHCTLPCGTSPISAHNHTDAARCCRASTPPVNPLLPPLLGAPLSQPSPNHTQHRHGHR